MSQQLMVVGAGLMGSGIAQVAAATGWEVTLRDISEPALDRAMQGIDVSLSRFAAKGTLTADDKDAALARIQTTTDLETAAGVDLVVEAVSETLEIKHEVFATLDKVCRDGTVLATNTSAIPITKIAAATGRPEAVVGTHFFSPVPMMQLCELVRGLKTSDETLATARSFAEEAGKTC
ncbi:MAG: 3-hydroxybutyryl-CoA dehydrogenase, partial [Propionibacteriales bacterium]|nr:3-hydroxybutyryl-CoA dehydrogenase [Propionibacteriales bacterium]